MTIGGTSPVPADGVPRDRPVGREVRLSAARSDGGRDRGVQLPRRDRHRWAGAQPDLPHRERRAQRADRSRCSSFTARRTRTPAGPASTAAGTRRRWRSSRTGRRTSFRTRSRRGRRFRRRRGWPVGIRRIRTTTCSSGTPTSCSGSRGGGCRTTSPRSRGRRSCCSCGRSISTRGRVTSTRSRLRRARGMGIRWSVIRRRCGRTCTWRIFRRGRRGRSSGVVLVGEGEELRVDVAATAALRRAALGRAAGARAAARMLGRAYPSCGRSPNT